MIQKKQTTKSKILGCLAGILAVLLPGAGHTFIPTAPQLLYMMSRAMGNPSGIVIHQTRIIPDRLSSFKDETRQYSFMEKLTISCPEKVRSDVLLGTNSGYSVEDGSHFVKVVNQNIVSVTKSLEDHYTDVLLYRHFDSLKDFLVSLGVDTNKIKYDRYHGKICYVIGKPDREQDFSGVWIDHETFFPVGYRVHVQNQTIDFFYEDWQKISSVQYPMQITMFVNNQVVTQIKADHIELTDKLPDSLFQVQEILQKYPRKMENTFSDDTPQKPDRADRIRELDNEIKNFEKMYE